MRPLLLLIATVLLVACAPAAPPAGLARAQAAGAGSPPVAWHDATGRCTVPSPLSRLSCRMVVRRNAEGSVRLALLADEGVLLCDVTVSGGVTTVHAVVPDLASQAGRLGMMAWQAWGQSATAGRGHWRDDVWVMEDGGGHRRGFGGDPLLLREVTGYGPHLEIGDYRLWQGGLLARQVRLADTGVSVTLRLEEPLPDPATTGLNRLSGAGTSVPP